MASHYLLSINLDKDSMIETDIKIIGSYESYNNAEKALDKTAKNFITEEEGGRKAKECFNHVSEHERDFGYFVSKESNSKVVLCLKEKSTGYLYNSYHIQRVRLWSIVESGCDEKIVVKVINDNNKTTKKVNNKFEQNHVNLINELKEHLEKNKDKFRHISAQPTKTIPIPPSIALEQYRFESSSMKNDINPPIFKNVITPPNTPIDVPLKCNRSKFFTNKTPPVKPRRRPPPLPFLSGVSQLDTILEEAEEGRVGLKTIDIAKIPVPPPRPLTDKEKMENSPVVLRTLDDFIKVKRE